MPTAGTANPSPNMVSQVHACSAALSDREVVTTPVIGDRLFAAIGGGEVDSCRFISILYVS